MNTEIKQPSPLKAIRLNCIECSGGDKAEVALCPMNKCPLYAFRFGKKPQIKYREKTEEQRLARVVQLQSARSQKTVLFTGNKRQDAVLI
jgi:hypothetical protein